MKTWRSDSNNDSLPSLVTPNRILWRNDTASISLIGAAALKWLIDVGEVVYTINIQPTSNYLDIAALHTVGSQPAPTSALHSEPPSINKRNYLPKSSLRAYKDFFDVSQEKRLRTCLLIMSLTMKFTCENDQTPPHSHIYPLSGTELGLLREFPNDMLGKGFIRSSQSPGGAQVLFAKKKDGTLQLCVDFRTSKRSLKRIGTRFHSSPTSSTN